MIWLIPPYREEVRVISAESIKGYKATCSVELQSVCKYAKANIECLGEHTCVRDVSPVRVS